MTSSSERLERLKHKWKYNEYQYLDIIELIEALIKQNDDLKQELEELKGNYIPKVYI